LNPTTSAWTDYTFAGGKRIAKDTSNNGTGTQYYQEDHLGSARIMTDNAGTVISNCTFNAFGEQVSCSPDNASNHYKFTGKERDSETGLDNFGARYYSGGMGRFLTVDPKVASAHVANPQSWNRYTYALNNPMVFIDPDGRETTTSLRGDDYARLINALAADYRKPSFRAALKDLKQNKMVHEFGKMQTVYTPKPGTDGAVVTANPGDTKIVNVKIGPNGKPDLSNAGTQIRADLGPERLDGANTEAHEVRHGVQVQNDPEGMYQVQNSPDDSPERNKAEDDANAFAAQVAGEKADMTQAQAEAEVKTMIPEPKEPHSEAPQCKGPQCKPQ
jgi:RHS repeat-associated protein